MENLENLKYKDLQKLAKEAGIKANSPKAVLIEALKEVQTPSDAAHEEYEAREQSVSAGEQSKLNETFEKIDVEAQNKENETFEKENTLNTTFDKNESIETLDESKEGSRFMEFMEDGKDEISFRRSSRVRVGRSSTPISTVKSKPKTPKLDYLSKRNKTPLRKTSKTPSSIQKKSVESNIPRFVQYSNAQKVKSSARKVPNFAKIHEKNFKKMESLDDYVEKKKKLTDTVTKQLDKARELAREHTNIVRQVKSSLNAKFAPAVTSIDKMNLNFGNVSTSVQGSQPFKFSAKSATKTAPVPKILPKERKDIKVSTRARTTVRSKIKQKAEKVVEEKPLMNITNKSMNETKTPAKKFDLAASLAKPLTYQPHKGKLKPIEKKRKDSIPALGARTKEEAKQRQMEVIKGVRLNKRAELLMMRRKNSE